MLFQVTEIEFDFSDSCYELSENDMINITDDSLGRWDADDEDDLIEEITAATGWYIKSIDYKIILN
jgi:hypothetical protein